MKPTSFQQKLLHNRNISENDWENFLKPDFEKGLYDPWLLPDMEKAVERILSAISNNEKIVIYSDYDCDGIPGGALLRSFFDEIGYKNIANYIPHRHKEGYGLNIPALEKFVEDGVKLVITVDLGITNTDEVSFAQKKRIDVIVTDHHLPHTEVTDGVTKQILPEAFAVINAKRSDNMYPDDMLCGCATAWKLVCALVERGKEKNIRQFEEIGEGFTKWLLDLVAISTVADMVPLVKENRVLAYYGLIVLRKSKRKGIHALALKAGIKLSDVTEEDIAFSFAPRINAASRMDIPMEAFELLMAGDEKTAQDKATYLEGLNNNRKTSVASAVKKAYKHAEGAGDNPVLVVGDTEWSPGILGLIAGKLKDEYNKTVFVWGRDEDGKDFKGSCRSDGKTHLVDLMQACVTGTFTAMGGHELAGGFSVSETEIHDLEERLNTAYLKIIHKNIEATDDVSIDGNIFLEDLTQELYKEMQCLAPFGVANHKPTFMISAIEIQQVALFGKTKNHLKLVFGEKGGKTIEAIKFFSGDTILDGKEEKKLEAGTNVTITCNLEKENFGYKRGLRLRIVDVTLV